MDLLEKSLKSILYRSGCPSKMDLGEYKLGLLSPQRGDEVATHLMSCAHCQLDLVQMLQFMALPAADMETAPKRVEQEQPLLERIKIIVVDLLSQPAGFLQSPASMQPVMRGGESEIQTQVIQADAYIIALTAQTKHVPGPRQQIIGDITPLDDDECLQDWTAHLWQSGELLASTKVAADSHFMFDDIRPSGQRHDLILSGPTTELHLQNLQIA